MASYRFHNLLVICYVIKLFDFYITKKKKYKSVRIAKISILKLVGIIKKISYERRDYESVDEKSIS